MASKRRLRRKMCDGKRKHNYLTQAVWALERTERKKGHGVLGVYLCPFCGFWHVGHIRRQNMTRTDYQYRLAGGVQVSLY